MGAPSTQLAGAARALAIVCALAPVQEGYAQTYPAKPLRLVVPVGPGGGTDILGRAIAQRLGDALGQLVVVENRGGAAGNIGTEIVAKAAPDGYTLVIVNTSFAVNPSLYRNMPFDTVRDLTPITHLTISPLLLVAHPSLPVKSTRELIALAKSRPGELNFASSGSGQSNHLAGELFNTMAQVKMVHVPYRGGGAVLTDLLGGHVTLFFGGIISTLPHAKSGKLRPLGVTSLKRTRAIPEVPTIAEAALPGFEAVGWYGILGPAGLPAPIVGRLSAEIMKIVQMPEMQERIVKDGSDPVGSTPEQFAAFIRSEMAKWGKVVRESGARID
jgi:tripartite-type tricarboxylate transporter receptor subunit TctC